MKAKIHRGADEVGGSCIEVEARGYRIVLDLGRPLTGEGERPAVAGLEEHDRSLLGVVITHPHLDHYGLAVGIESTVPVFMGEAGWRMLNEARFFTGAEPPPRPVMFLRHRETFTVGPFQITPYLNDHSAFDAYSLLIEADGRRLFYTGDFRGHGRKRRVFEQLLRSPPVNVDVLLMEGTNIGRDANVTEADVEDQVAAVTRQTAGLVLACYSPQNIDRLVTMFRAARRAGRELVLDLYAATMAAATGQSTIPQASWDGVRVYLPRSQQRRVIAAKAFERTRAVHAKRIFADELVARRSELIVSCRASMLAELPTEGATAIWSMWTGYLTSELEDELRRREIPLTVSHSSGHAFVADLQRLAHAMAARRLVPIHSFAGDQYAALFPRVVRRRDGEWWEV